MGSNELWQLETGYIAGYTEDTNLIQRVKRYKTENNWRVMAEYRKCNQFLAVQFKIPINERRQAERMFDVKLEK